jgi:hypothetical protein
MRKAVLLKSLSSRREYLSRSLIVILLLTQCMLAFHGASASGGSLMRTGRATAKVYNAETHDPYETVVAWYRKRLVGAKESESGYVKDTLTFSLQNGRQVIVQGRPPITYITLSANAD